MSLARRPESWGHNLTEEELLELLWVLEATIDKQPELKTLLENVVASDLFAAEELPQPTQEEREPPKVEDEAQQLTF
jgi:hypothetical protein